MIDPPLLAIDTVTVGDSSNTLDSSTGPDTQPLLDHVSLTIHDGETHVVTGPNRHEPLALAHVLLGSPSHPVTSGRLRFRGDDITEWPTDARARAGLFVSFGRPPGLVGVSQFDLLRHAVAALSGPAVSQAGPAAGSALVELRDEIHRLAGELSLDATRLHQPIGDDLNATDAARVELLHMAVLRPRLAVLDNTGSDVDIDTIDEVTRAVDVMRRHRPDLGCLILAGHQRLVQHFRPDVVHVLMDGRLTASGGTDVVARLESDGYESFT